MTSQPQTSTVHRAPTGCASSVPCCGEQVFDLPRTDRMTVDGDVTCGWAEGAPLPDQQLAVWAADLTWITKGPWLVAGGEYDQPMIYVEYEGSDDRTAVRVLLSGASATEADVQFMTRSPERIAALLAEVTRLRAALVEEESVCRDRGHWLAQVDAALTAAGQDEGGGYIAYARRITEVAAERDRLRAADAAVLAVMAYYRDAPDDASRWAILSDLAIARDGHIPEHLAPAPACSCGAVPVHQAGRDGA